MLYAFKVSSNTQEKTCGILVVLYIKASLYQFAQIHEANGRLAIVIGCHIIYYMNISSMY